MIEADGGSRGNPGPAAYGAVLKDADTGEVIAEDGATIGLATNNVAEYSGLIAGLRLAQEFAPDADIEVRMDSKLVVEQMSGRWKIKHPDMRPLAAEAKQLAPDGYDVHLGAARPEPARRPARQRGARRQAVRGDRCGRGACRRGTDRVADRGAREPGRGGAPSPTVAGRLPVVRPPRSILVRHGVTPHTVEKRFSGGLASSNPGLSDEGRDQVRATADWLSPLAEQVDAVIASPVRRTLESAEIVAEVLGKKVDVEPGFAEMEFGTWDGKTFMDVAEQHKEELDSWLGSLDVSPGGGESFRVVEKRVLDGLQRVLDEHTGKTVVVVSHVTPIKTMVAHAVTAPLDAVFRMELSPASVSVLAFYGGGEDGSEPRASMRLYNALPPARDPFDRDRL